MLSRIEWHCCYPTVVISIYMFSSIFSQQYGTANSSLTYDPLQCYIPFLLQNNHQVSNLPSHICAAVAHLCNILSHQSCFCLSVMAFYLFQITSVTCHHHFEFSSFLSKGLRHLPAGMTYKFSKLTLFSWAKSLMKILNSTWPMRDHHGATLNPT